MIKINIKIIINNVILVFNKKIFFQKDFSAFTNFFYQLLTLNLLISTYRKKGIELKQIIFSIYEN